jgi:hypothetical protein
MRYFFLFLLGLSFFTFAEQKFNPMTGKFETVRPGSQLKYNPMEDEWRYVPPNS